MTKVLLLGIDGGTWRILSPLVDEGKMPNLASIIKSGASGILESTIPPITAPAWTTFMTGVSPGKHGIFEFNNYDGKYGTYFTNNSHIKYKTIWEILSDYGKRVISINVPMTYPPFPVRGALVTGMLTPGTSVTFTYPEELSETIRKEIKGYKIMTTGSVYALYGLHKFVEELKKTIRKRAELGKFLLTTEEWDVAMVHFQSSDVVQHFAYHCLSPEHPMFNPECRKKAVEVYEELDRAIGEILDLVEKHDKVFKIILSDHGFQPVYKNVVINGLLYKHGYLVVKNLPITKKITINMIKTIRGLDFLNLYRWILSKNTKEKLKEKAKWGSIDFSRSRVFVINGWLYGNLFINLKGREPTGIVEPEEYEGLRDELKEILEGERDPETGGKYLTVLKKEEAFGETELVGAPDLIVIPGPGYSFSTSSFVDRTTIKKNRPRADHTGNHEREGIIIMQGEGVKENFRGGASIIDLLPTILWYLNLPIPEYAEGSVIRDFFKKEFSERKPEKREGISPERNIEGSSYDDDELLKERLQSLGYL